MSAAASEKLLPVSIMGGCFLHVQYGPLFAKETAVARKMLELSIRISSPN